MSGGDLMDVLVSEAQVVKMRIAQGALKRGCFAPQVRCAGSPGCPSGAVAVKCAAPLLRAVFGACMPRRFVFAWYGYSLKLQPVFHADQGAQGAG
jgi:hypothetical protein